MKSLLTLIPLFVLLFGKLFCEIGTDTVYPNVEKLSNMSRTAIDKRYKWSIEPVPEIEKVDASHTANGDAELMEVAETHLFRPLLVYRIPKSSHNSSEPSTNLSRRNN